MPEWDDRPQVHDAAGLEKMRAACTLAARVLDAAGALVAPGVRTDEIDAAVHEMAIAAGAYPSPLNYGAFPKSVCTSVNEVICHGIPDSRPLKEGDIVNIDVTVYLNVSAACAGAPRAGAPSRAVDCVIGGGRGGRGSPLFRSPPARTPSLTLPLSLPPSPPPPPPCLPQGYHGDTSRMFHVGAVSPEAAALCAATSEALAAGIAACGPGARYAAIGDAIQTVADARGFGTCKTFVGHGVGTVFHSYPHIQHHRNNSPGTMSPGMTFTIEPMLTEGSARERVWKDKWTAVTSDGGLSAQQEHTLLITDSGVEILTVA
jgi:methionyl aminopeptidase